jgi:hypothetical protein
MNVQEIGPMSAEGVRARMAHQAFLDSLGGLNSRPTPPVGSLSDSVRHQREPSVD